MLGNLIAGFIVIIVGISIAPTVANEVEGARFNASGDTGGRNITGASSTILGLVTLFYVLGIASAAIGIATVGLRNSGLM
jgi:hypothetical protein